MRLKRIILCAGIGLALLAYPPAWAAQDQERQFAAVNNSNKKILGCWGDADKGDSADLKLMFVSNGAMIQYDENQEDNKKRTFGAWEMLQDSTYLTVYWPTGNITRYNVKRIGPILHFSGLNGVENFTLRKLKRKRCWEKKG